MEHPKGRLFQLFGSWTLRDLAEEKSKRKEAASADAEQAQSTK
jgi:hypothetical protein